MAERKKMQWNSMLDGTPNYTGGWGSIEDVDAAYDNLGNRKTPLTSARDDYSSPTGSGYSYNYSSSGRYANPDTAGKLAGYENSRPKYSQSQDVTDAWNKVKDLEGSKPGDYVSKYGDQIQALLDKILNRDPFKYDFNADPMYQMYKDRYLQQGRMAMQDTMGDAAALTGGYGNSYAATAGQQAYQSYLQGLNDRIPDLRDFAYNAWLNEGDRMNSHLSILQGLEDTDYARYRDTVGDYKDELNYYYNKYGDMSDREYNRYLNDASAWEKDRDYWFNKWQWEQEFNYKTAMAAAAAAAASLGSGRSGGSSGEGKSTPTSTTNKKTYSGSTYNNGKKTGSILAGAGPMMKVTNTPAYGAISTKEAQDNAKFQIWSQIAAASTKGADAAQKAYDAAVKSGLLLPTKDNKATISYIRRWSR